ncbi:MAG: CGNR zinc finger domain-containing protein [Pseudonocardia sp.]|nr:CGNR zinc finger domain-containing protein [Pseudonocardia sp.]
MSEFRTGNGADWLDLLATLLGRFRSRQVEMLPDAAALRAWFAEHGMEPAAEVTVADLTAARALREALHRAAVATLDERPVDARDLAILQDALAADQGVDVHRDGTRLQLDRPADAAVALAWLARQAALDLTGPTRERLHACGDATCSGIFIDHTGRRRWCSDERCGVRSRVRAHRARARERSSG